LNQEIRQAQDVFALVPETLFQHFAEAKALPERIELLLQIVA
jgi:hypothetical protein